MRRSSHESRPRNARSICILSKFFSTASWIRASLRGFFFSPKDAFARKHTRPEDARDLARRGSPAQARALEHASPRTRRSRLRAARSRLLGRDGRSHGARAVRDDSPRCRSLKARSCLCLRVEHRSVASGRRAGRDARGRGSVTGSRPEPNLAPCGSIRPRATPARSTFPRTARSRGPRPPRRVAATDRRSRAFRPRSGARTARWT